MKDEQADLIMYITVLGVCPVIGVCGIVANIINIIILKRNGFTESVNVSLLGLAVSDLMALIFTVPVAVFRNPHFADSQDLWWNATDFSHFILGTTDIL
ncbi:chemosensory receptor A [Elysia marginata]|uniref:Chemosensory receptor A n=1 Tax=Elysia marginata TaxID=1093978 RepID=A0AAV4ES54_9GAST|nr:chemosensory receptor A [Elysia marginata]